MKIILFDIDGTLIVSGGAGQAALESALTDLFELEKLVEGIPYTGRTDVAIINNLFSAHNIEPTQANVDRLKQEYMRRLPNCLRELKGRVLPGVVELLQRLTERDDVVMGVLTGNQSEGARLKLERYEIFQYFELGFYGDVHQYRDDVAREALAQLSATYGDSISPADIIIIGDTPADIQCARAIHATAIAVQTGWHSPEELIAAEADLLLEDLTDHELLLQMLAN